MKQDTKNALLFLTNKHDIEILATFSEIKLQTNQKLASFLVYHQLDNFIPQSLLRRDPIIICDRILTELSYTPLFNKLIPGSNHFAVLSFYRQNPTYDYYWYIEDDVRFNGDWNCFFDNFIHNKADFLTSHIRHQVDEPNWFWWNFIRFKGITPTSMKLVASFNPIFRISRDALTFIDECLSKGWSGHHEVVLPTLLVAGGYQVEDFGGDGSYVPLGRENCFYHNTFILDDNDSLSSMRFRPVIKPEEMTCEILYHPVKLEKYSR